MIVEFSARRSYGSDGAPSVLSSLLLRIPLMMITDSGLMVISSERSDAGVFMIPEVIGMGQGLGSIRSLADESSSSRFSLFWGCEA